MNSRRQLGNGLARAVIYLTAVLALVPLGLVLWYTIVRGLPAVTHLEFFTNVERPPGIPGGGIAHAIWGTVIMVGLASLLAIPVGVVGGIHLAEYGRGRLANWIRL
ncbi:MAG: phosphate ABC transporter permease PtsA, partial [Chloroflexi bacterium]